MNSDVLLFFGSHGKGPHNVGNIENAEAAIVSIKKTTKTLLNKDIILVIEMTGWQHCRETVELMMSRDKEKARSIFINTVNYYKDALTIIKRGGNVENPDWATILMKFGIDNGYLVELEDAKLEFPWRLLIEFENEDEVQKDRDENFVKQIIELKKNHPNKTIITARGSKHKKWIPEILTKNNLSYKMFDYKNSPNVFERLKYLR